MQISANIQSQLPNGLMLLADSDENPYIIGKVIDIKKGITSKVVGEYEWFYSGTQFESVFIAINDNNMEPSSDPILYGITVKEFKHGPAVGHLAFWRGHLWAYSCFMLNRLSSNYWPQSTYVSCLRYVDFSKSVHFVQKYESTNSQVLMLTRYI